MKFLRPFVCTSALLAAALPAQTPPATGEPDLRTLLRDALFEEEASRDLDKAAAGYESILTEWSEQRSLAASALFRLAEVRRKQGRNEDAARLYQRLTAEFGDIEPQARLSRENLAALGVDAPVPDAGAIALSDEETAELARVQKLAVESPDLLTGDEMGGELANACSKSWLAVVKFLLSKGIADDGSGLGMAASAGHLAVVRELLNQKFPSAEDMAAHWQKPEQQLGLTNALGAAAEEGHTAVVRLLLEEGASVDYPESSTKSNMSALTRAILRGNVEIAELLLAHKASVTPPNAKVTPLYAAAGGRGNAPLVQRLLDLGADVQAGGSAERFLLKSDPATDGATPLHAAVKADSVECVTALIKAKANPDALTTNNTSPLDIAASAGSAEIIAELLAAGAAPDGRGPDETRYTPLRFAIDSSHPAAVAALLKGKADPNFLLLGQPPLVNAVVLDNEKIRDEIVALLLENGADPTLGGNAAIKNAPVALKVKLLRDYVYPKLAGQPAVTLVFGDAAVEATLAERRTPEDQPASLASVLLAWHEKGGWSADKSNEFQAVPDWSTLRLWRKAAEGSLTETGIALQPGAEYPALQWGDVIEVVSPDWNKPDAPAKQNQIPGARVAPLPGRGRTSIYQIPDNILAILRSTLTARITFTCGDFTQALTLRGSLRTYDLQTGEAPLIPAAQLVRLLGGDRTGQVKIERAAERGGGTVEWAAGSDSGKRPPEDGDTITFTPEPPDGQRVTLRVNGQPGIWSGYSSDQQPMLLQFLADFYSALPFYCAEPSWQILRDDLPREQRAAFLKAMSPAAIATALLTSPAEAPARPSLQWPDWSKVKVRRWVQSGPVVIAKDKDGKLAGRSGGALGDPETLDLAAAMHALTDASTPEEARKFDITLKPGDEVELSLLTERPAGPWPGLDAAAVRLFQKAFSANVTIVEPDGRFREVTRQWLPPRWVSTTAGLIPVPDGEVSNGRTPWLHARDLADSVSPGTIVRKLIREGKEHVYGDNSDNNPSDFFLRPGDILHLEITRRTPRPRVVVPLSQ